MRLRDNVQVRELIEGEWAQIFDKECDHLRTEAKKRLLKFKMKTFNKKRKESMKYVDGVLVAIKRTRTGPSLKFRPKFLGPYRVYNAERPIHC